MATYMNTSNTNFNACIIHFRQQKRNYTDNMYLLRSAIAGRQKSNIKKQSQ